MIDFLGFFSSRGVIIAFIVCISNRLESFCTVYNSCGK